MSMNCNHRYHPPYDSHQFDYNQHNPSWKDIAKTVVMEIAPVAAEGFSSGIAALLNKYEVTNVPQSAEDRIAELQSTVNVLTAEKAQLIKLVHAQERKIAELSASQEVSNG